MKVTDAYDEQSDSWYFTVHDGKTWPVIHHTHTLPNSTVNLDIAVDGTILGIEIV